MKKQLYQEMRLTPYGELKPKLDPASPSGMTYSYKPQSKNDRPVSANRYEDYFHKEDKE